MKNIYNIITGPQSLQGSQQWLDFRMDKISSTDAASILGESPYETALECWERKNSNLTKECNRFMQRGKDMEPKALAWINNNTAMNYRPVVLQLKRNPYIITSLDGFLEDVNGDPCILEIKCPGFKDHASALEGKIPDHYIPQLDHHLMVSGAAGIIYVSFDGDDGVILYHAANAMKITKLYEMETEFHKSLVNMTPPLPTKLDWQEFSDIESTQDAKRYKDLSSLIAQLEAEHSSIKYRMIERVKHPRSKIGDLKIQKIVRKGSIDFDAVLKKYSIIDAENFRKDPIESWRLSYE